MRHIDNKTADRKLSLWCYNYLRPLVVLVPRLGRMTKWPNGRTEWPNDRIGLFGIVPSLMLKGQLLNIIKFMGDIDWDLTFYRFLDMLNPNLACKFLSAHSFFLFQKSHCHLGNSSPNCPWYHRYWLWKSSSPGLLSILILNRSIHTSVRLFLLCISMNPYDN